MNSNKIYTVKFTSRDGNKLTAEIVAESYEQAQATARSNYSDKGYKSVKVLKSAKSAI